MKFLCEDEGLRLDRFLAMKMPDWSRAQLTQLIKRGSVLVEGKRLAPDARLKPGAMIEVALTAEAPAASAGKLEHWIMHEDKDILVLNKPAGLLMHPLSPTWLSAPEAALESEPSLAAALWRLGPAQRAVPRVGIVHRLDRETSGALLVAKNAAAFASLTEAFRDRRVRKIYRAIVRGRPAKKLLRVEAPIGRPPGKKRVVVTALGRESSTEFSVVKSCAAAALVEARPLTGRTHQIRAHLSFLDHPVAGDPDFDTGGVEPKPPRLMLHAYAISFAHPGTGKTVTYRAPLPKDFRDFWTAIQP